MNYKDLKEKLDPYMQPLYDALIDMLPSEKLKDYLEQGKNNLQRMHLEYFYSPFKDIFVRILFLFFWPALRV